MCFTQAGALEKIVKASQLEIIELQHSVGELRYLLSFSFLYSCTETVKFACSPYFVKLGLRNCSMIVRLISICICPDLVSFYFSYCFTL